MKRFVKRRVQLSQAWSVHAVSTPIAEDTSAGRSKGSDVEPTVDTLRIGLRITDNVRILKRIRGETIAVIHCHAGSERVTRLLHPRSRKQPSAEDLIHWPAVVQKLPADPKGKLIHRLPLE